jgi:hypothetical protein
VREVIGSSNTPPETAEIGPLSKKDDSEKTVDRKEENNLQGVELPSGLPSPDGYVSSEIGDGSKGIEKDDVQ